jgi:hypothetical protein
VFFALFKTGPCFQNREDRRLKGKLLEAVFQSAGHNQEKCRENREILVTTTSEALAQQFVISRSSVRLRRVAPKHPIKSTAFLRLLTDLAANQSAGFGSHSMLNWSTTHSADFVPCFVAFERNVRPYAHLMAVCSQGDNCLREGVPVGHPFWKHVESQQP